LHLQVQGGCGDAPVASQRNAAPKHVRAQVAGLLALVLGAALLASHVQPGSGRAVSMPEDQKAMRRLSVEIKTEARRWHRRQHINVLQVEGPPARAQVLHYLGEGMYRVRYTVDQEVETVSEGRFRSRDTGYSKEASLQSHDEDVEPGGGGKVRIDFGAHTEHGRGLGFYVLLVLGLLVGLFAAAGIAYASYWYCRFPKRLPIREGAYVVVTRECMSDNKKPTILRKGDRGQVIRLDKNFALIDFYDYENQWVSHKNHQYLSVSAYGPVPAPARLAC